MMQRPETAVNGKSVRSIFGASSLLHKLTRGNIFVFCSGLLLTILVAGTLISKPAFLLYLDDKLYDLLLVQLERPPLTKFPVVIDIDDKSLAEFGQWPWPRYRLAQLLAKIADMGAVSAGLDILFAETDRTSPEIIREQLSRDFDIHVDFSGIPPELMDHDRFLAQVLSEGPFVLGFYFTFQKIDATERAVSYLRPVPCIVLSEPGSKPVESALLNATAVIPPLEVLSKAARWGGYVNAMRDRDGLLRRTPLLISFNGQIYPSLALACLMQATNIENLILRVSPGGIESIGIGSVTIPLDKQGMLLLRYRGKGRTFPYYSAGDVLAGRVQADALDGKIVFVGSTAAGLKDLHPTPTDQHFPGIEVHATVLDNIIRGDFINIPDWAPGIELLLCVLVGVTSSLLLAWSRGVWIALPAAALAISTWWSASYLLSSHGIYFPPTTIILMLGGNLTVLTLLKFWKEERQKKFFHRAFSQYVSPAIVQQMVASPEKLTLVGEEKEVSILFSDIRGFTTISENLPPTQVSGILKAFFTPMARTITANMGTMDKFIGDAIMAFWNAPLNTAGHQRLAVKAALEMLDRLTELNPDLVREFGLELKIGIGLHCGSVRVGNMGSEDLFDYTIIGDSVNLASRIEGLTKSYGVSLLVTDSIRSACGDEFFFLEVDTVRVKGRSNQVTVYAPYAIETAMQIEKQLEDFKHGLDLFKSQDFHGAVAVFTLLCDTFPGHELFVLYRHRALTQAKDPPPIVRHG